jgi:hypothetical protein
MVSLPRITNTRPAATEPTDHGCPTHNIRPPPIVALVVKSTSVPRLLPQPLMLDTTSAECEVRAAGFEAGAVRHQGHAALISPVP